MNTIVFLWKFLWFAFQLFDGIDFIVLWKSRSPTNGWKYQISHTEQHGMSMCTAYAHSFVIVCCLSIVYLSNISNLWLDHPLVLAKIWTNACQHHQIFKRTRKLVHLSSSLLSIFSKRILKNFTISRETDVHFLKCQQCVKREHFNKWHSCYQRCWYCRTD